MTKFNTFKELVAISPVSIQERLEKLKTNRERLDFHPEGNTYEHIKIVTERLMGTGNIDLIIAGLFHDLGKLETTKPHPKFGHPTAYGHENVSAKLVIENRDFIEGLGANTDIVHCIVKNHMRVKQYDKMRPKKQEEIDTLPCLNKLKLFSRADDMLNNFYNF